MGGSTVGDGGTGPLLYFLCLTLLAWKESTSNGPHRPPPPPNHGAALGVYNQLQK